MDVGAARRAADVDDCVDVEVRGRPGRVEGDDLVCLGVWVPVSSRGGDGDGGRTARSCGAQDPDCDLASVGDEELHGCSAKSARAVS